MFVGMQGEVCSDCTGYYILLQCYKYLFIAKSQTGYIPKLYNCVVVVVVVVVILLISYSHNTVVILTKLWLCVNL